MRWHSGTVLEEHCGGTVEQCWRNRGTVLVEQWNSDSRTVKQCLWNSVVEQWNSVDGTVWWNTVGGTVE